MSNGAMVGLLEGLGQGMVRTGDMMAKNELAAAEDARRMNLEKVRREWATADRLDERKYQEGVKSNDQLYAQKEAQIAESKAETIRNTDRADKWDALGYATNEKTKDRQATHGDRMAELQFGVNNREDTAADKLIARADEALATGKITAQEYKQVTLGVGKTESMTGKDAATLRMEARKQASIEVIGKDPMKSATPEQTKEINAKAEEIFSQSLGKIEKQASAIPGSTTIIDGKTYKVNADGKTMSPVAPTTAVPSNPAMSQEDQAWSADAARRDEEEQIRMKATAAKKKQDAMNQDISNFGAGNGLLEQF
jgi:hypothetical protein